MFEVFFDAAVLYILTALVILCMTGFNPETIPYKGTALVAWCFNRQLGIIGRYLASGFMVIFAFVATMAWFYLGRQVAAYLIGGCGFGENAQHMFTAKVYPLLLIVAVFLGNKTGLGLVWLLSDIWNGLMTFSNLTALLLLSREVILPEGFLRRRD